MLKTIKSWQLIPNFRRDILKLWSVRLALFWGAISGLLVAWPAFQDVVPLRIFAGGCVLMTMAIFGARATHQPGLDT